MPPAPYSDLRWFVRTVRVLPVVAVAALAGGAIGGFSVFAIDFALTSPPSHEVRAAAAKPDAAKAVAPAPLRTFDAAGPYDSGGTSAPPSPQQAATPQSSVSVPQAPQVQTPIAAAVTPPAQSGASAPQAPQVQAPIPTTVAPPPAQQKTWPDALSRAHQTAPAAAEAALAKPAPAAAEADAQSVAPAPPATAELAKEPVKPETGRIPPPAKRRVAVRRNTPMPSGRMDETASQNGRAVYDVYGGDDEPAEPAAQGAARGGYQTPSQRTIVRRQRPDRMDGPDDDRSGESAAVMPPQPAPPPFFFGLFGGDRGDQ
jgi:hypothetical protein